jgi:hypothetical protein
MTPGKKGGGGVLFFSTRFSSVDQVLLFTRFFIGQVLLARFFYLPGSLLARFFYSFIGQVLLARFSYILEI